MSVEAMERGPVASQERFVFVDVLRLVATFQMVQGHTLDAVIAAELREGFVHDAWQQLRGLTAVAFLFAAGLAFHITTLRRFERYQSDTAAQRRRRLRALRLVALGYLLHIPLALLWTSEPSSRAQIIDAFLGVDVLQCIGVSLLTLELLAKVSSSAGGVQAGALLLAGVAFVGGRFAPSIDVVGPWSPLLAYVSTSGESIFPLLPWAGHLWLGVVIAGWAERAWVSRFALSSAALGGVALVVRVWPGWEMVAMHLGRLSAVTLVCASLAWALRSRGRLPGWLERLAGETLVVYMFHILLVYGAGAGLASTIGPTLTIVPALMVTLLVLLASAGVALGWPWLSRRPGLAAPAGKR